jgi:hypothetical protein
VLAPEKEWIHRYSMSTVKEIESAISRLSPSDLAQLRAWFAEFDANAWDQQIEADADNGRLDVFYESLQQENEGQPDVPLKGMLIAAC